MNEQERSEEDQNLIHIASHHILLSVMHLEVALEELEVNTEDERFGRIKTEIEPLLDELIEICQRIYDDIPGMPSREEVEEYLLNYATHNIAGLFNDDLPLQ